MTDSAPQAPTKIQEILADTFRFTRRELAFSFAGCSPKGPVSDARGRWAVLGEIESPCGYDAP